MKKEIRNFDFEIRAEVAMQGLDEAVGLFGHYQRRKQFLLRSYQKFRNL